MIRGYIQRLGQRNPNCPFERLDPRCKLLMLLIVTAMVIVGDGVACAGLFVAVGLLACFSRLVKLFFITSIFSIILWCVFFVIFNTVLKRPLDDPRAMFFGMVFRGTTLTITGVWFAMTTKLRDMTAALEAWKIPAVIILPLTIAVRFIPTLLHESLVIRDSMRLRRIAYRRLDLLRKPHLIGHSYLALVTIRSLKMADELAAVAETRGLARPGIKNTYRPACFKKCDYYALGLLTSLTIVLTTLSIVLP